MAYWPSSCEWMYGEGNVGTPFLGVFPDFSCWSQGECTTSLMATSTWRQVLVRVPDCGKATWCFSFLLSILKQGRSNALQYPLKIRSGRRIMVAECRVQSLPISSLIWLLGIRISHAGESRHLSDYFICPYYFTI